MLGKQLDQHGVRAAAVENDHGLDPGLDRGDGGFQLRDHAADSDARVHQAARFRNRHLADQGLVLVEHAGDVGQQQHALGVQLARHRAGAEADVRGVGLSGKDAGLITVEKATRTKKDPDSMIERVVDLGFVGEPKRVDDKLLRTLIDDPNHDYVPVIAPIGVSEEGHTFNINADTVAGAVAGKLNSKRMLLLTDIAGVLDENKNLIRQMTVSEAQALITTGVAVGGMIPKLETAIAAIEAGVEAVVILDGRRPHAMLVELFTEHGAGTLIRAD